MITETNYPTLFFPKMDDRLYTWYLTEDRTLTDNINLGQHFLNPNDAARFATKCGYSKNFIIEKWSYPYLIEYESGPIWQPQRYYLTASLAMDAWERWEEAAQLSIFINHTRIRWIDTGLILAEWKRKNQ